MTNENLIDKGIEKLREIEKSEDDIEKKLSNMSEVKGVIDGLPKEDNTDYIMAYIEFNKIYKEIINKLK
jgi:hypothetical protein